MRKVLAILLACSAVLAGSLASAGTLDPALQEQLPQAVPGEQFSVIVHLKHQAPVEAISGDLSLRKATRAQRHEEIVRALKDATASQEALLDDLNTARAAGDVTGYTRYWISNIVVVQATAEVIERLADRDDVHYIEPNFTITLIEPVAQSDVPRPSGELDTRGIGTTPGLDAVRAREVWELLGVDGSGALIGSLDTGVEGDHPAIASRWRGLTEPYQECWLDVIGSDPTFPSDFNSHGTHTVGTMCGLAPDDTIGVAPGAQWIAANAIDQGANAGFDNDIIECFQWFTDPDGNPATVDDVPDVVQNSWGVHEGFTGYDDCDDRWWVVIDNCEAAGVVVTWSAGNEGSSGLRSPADRAANFYNCFSVGSTLHSPPYTVSSFSSRGPSTCPGVFNPDYLVKPEISAPGSDIYSSVPGGGYGYKSGTSMAGPHVAGVVALMRAANPDLEVDLVKQIIMDTALDLGATGEDNDYGWGMIDAYECVLAAMNGFGTLEGTVTNASYGDAPLPGARIDFDATAQFTTAGVNGQYSVMVAPGTHDVTCNFAGFSPVQATVTINEDGVTVQDFALTDIAGPAITEVSNPVYTTDTVGPYTITARVADASTVVEARLEWVIDGEVGIHGAPMTLVGDDLYTAEISGGHMPNTQITYSVYGRDGAGLETQHESLSLYIAESAYSTDAELPGDPGWQLGVAGDGASSGLWVQADPVGTDYNGLNVQPEDDHTDAPGVACYVTGNANPGDGAGTEDVDDGCTTLVTPVFDLSQVDEAFVSYWRWYGEGGLSTDDDFVVEASNDGGASWVELERVVENQNSWQRVSVALTTLDDGQFGLTDQVLVRFLACDFNDGGLVEAAIDDFEIATFVGNPALGVDDETPGAVARLALHQNRPNPFNPATEISFALPHAASVDLAVYTVNGRRVATLVNQDLDAGEHRVIWDGRDTTGQRVASGAYFYRLNAGGEVQVKRMSLVK